MAKLVDRRTLLAAASAAAILPPRKALAAGGLAVTPSQTEGPFYPVAIPADADNDLVKVEGRAEAARGTPLLLRGRVLDARGRPLAGATVEIWQCDHQGHYLHPGDRGPRDPGFQGFGRATADEAGAYRFRTIRPVAYPGRTPHIHFAVLAPGRQRLVTQMYVDGDPRNARDFLYRSLGAAGQRAVTVALAPLAGAEAGGEAGTLGGRFDIVLPPG